MKIKVSFFILFMVCAAVSYALANDLEFCDPPGFGDAYRAAISNQVLNPRASEDLRPVTGLSGQVAERIYQAYLKSFVREDSSPANVVNFKLSPSGCNK